jgi:mannosyltransferase
MNSNVSSGRSLVWLGAIPLVLLTLCGAALRLYHLGTQSLWVDEITTAIVVKKGLSAIWEFTTQDVGPLPLSYVFEWLIVKVRDSEFFVRLPSCLFGVASIPLAYLVAHQLFRRKSVALVVAALLTFSAFHHYHSQEARGYMLYLALTLGAFYFFLRALENGRTMSWIGYGGLSLAQLYTTYFGVFVVAANAMYGAIRLLLSERSDTNSVWLKRQLLMLASITMILALLFLPWVLITHQVYAEYGTHKRPHTIVAVGSYLFITLKDYSGYSYVTLGVLLGIPLVGYFASRDLRRPLLLHYGLLLLLIPAAVIYLARIGHFLHPRFLIAALPYWLMLVAGGAVYLWTARPGYAPTPLRAGALRLVVFLAVGLLIAINARAITRDCQGEKQDWRNAAAYIAEHYQDGDLIVGGKNLGSVCIAYYLPPQLKRVVVYESYNSTAMRHLYLLNRRLWYVTAYFRTGGAKPYFDWIESHFELVKVFPGTAGDIRIFVTGSRSVQDN